MQGLRVPTMVHLVLLTMNPGPGARITQIRHKELDASENDAPQPREKP